MTRTEARRLPTHIAHSAVDAYRRGDLVAAARLCKQTLKRNKQDLKSLSLLSRIAEANGDAAGATDYLTRCVKADPRRVQTRLALGLTVMPKSE